MKTIESCPFCKSDNIVAINDIGLVPSFIYEVMPGTSVYASIISRYSKCTDCGLIFQSPRMSDPDLNKYYSQGYYRRSKNGTLEELDRNERYRARIDADIIKKHVKKIGSHLDIGCSHGYLLEVVWGDTKIGVESDVEWEMVEGIKVYNSLEEVPSQSFDLVTAIHVLEHVPDPFTYLKKIAKFVKKSGRLVIEVPTWKSPGGPLRLAHLYLFEPPFLRKMCMNAGLTVVHEEFTPHLLIICQLSR